jgi:hypothetical protein
MVRLPSLLLVDRPTHQSIASSSILSPPLRMNWSFGLVSLFGYFMNMMMDG